MAWTHLGTQFCLELAFGVWIALCLMTRAPLGVFFHRLMGATAALPLAVAAIVPPVYNHVPWTNPVTLAAGAALLAVPMQSGSVPSRRRFGATLWCATWAGVALVLAVSEAPGIAGPSQLLLASLSAMATGIVAGSVGLAMVVGHWYLTVPQLPVSWLAMLNRFTIGAMIVSALLLALTCYSFAEPLAAAETPLLGPWGLFFLGARVSVGLALPLLFAWMTAATLKYQNTRSATGILYASTVLVLIGTAVSLSLQDSYGIPL